LVFHLLEYNENVFTLRKDKNQGMSLGAFMSSHDVFFVFLKFMEGILVFYIWENIFLFEKAVGA
jgi:hypothetical protein